MVALRGGSFTASYGASKWAIRGLAKALAGELGFSGVRCNSIHPGNVRTPMIDNPSMIAMMTDGLSIIGVRTFPGWIENPSMIDNPSMIAMMTGGTGSTL